MIARKQANNNQVCAINPIQSKALSYPSHAIHLGRVSYAMYPITDNTIIHTPSHPSLRTMLAGNLG